MTHTDSLPHFISFVNRVGSGFSSLGLTTAPVEPSRLEASAIRKTGLSDFGLPGWRRGLDMLCRSANGDAGLSLIGRLGFRGLVTEALISRLRRVDLTKRHPEYFERPLRSPIVVVGARSGTTFLHRLLCSDPRSRSLAMWEVFQPVPPRGADRRRKAVLRQTAAHKRLYSNIDAKHHLDADQPEEDVFLLNSSFKSAAFYMMAPVYSYLEWLKDQELSDAYLEYLQHLQIFQAETPNRRLMLKAPAHLWSMGALLSAIPDALVVQTHREPVEVLASLNSLMGTMHAGFCDTFDARRMAKVNADLLEGMLERGDATLSSVPTGQVMHVRYDDLVAAPVKMVQKLYGHFGLSYSDDLDHRLRAFVANRRKDKFGRHDYSIENYGFTEKEIAERFSDYRAKYLEPGGHR